MQQRGSQYNKGSNISGLINPVNGHRGLQQKKGIQPKDHMKENRKALREAQVRNIYDRQEADAEPKDLYKLTQFQNVPSRAFVQKEQESVESVFLTRGASQKRRQNMAEESKALRAELDARMDEERYYNDRPETPRKTAVPTAAEQNKLQHNDVNFISRNRKTQVANSSSSAGPVNSGSERHQSFGRVPSYLEKRKDKWAAEENTRRRNAPDPDCPKGMVMMPESERVETLNTLKDSLRETNQELCAMPFVVETPSLRKKQVALESKMKEIETAIGLFSKPKVYISL